jgi:hypothetical protein
MTSSHKVEKTGQQARAGRTDQSLQCEQRSSGRTEDSVLRGRLHEKWLLLTVRARSLYLCVRMQIRALTAEICSLAYRIRILQKNRLAEFGLNVGPLYEKDPDGHLVLCMRTRACNQDIVDFQKRYPWLSLMDLYLLQKAWVVGFETCARRAIGSDNQCRTDLP